MKFLSRTLSLVFLSHAACFVSDDFAPKTEGMTPDSGISTDAVAPFVPLIVWVDNLRSEAVFDVNTSAVDSKGNIYLAGSCKSDKSITIGNQDHPAIRNSPQTLDYFIVSLDTDGDFRWFQRFGTDSTVSEEVLERDEIYEIIFDENDNLYLAGQYRGTLTIQGLADNLTAPPSKTAAFVVSFDKEGNVRWLQSYTREEPESSLWASYASSLTIDSDGQLQVLLHSYGPTSSYLISVLEVRAYALETGDSEVAAKEIARGNLTRKPTIRSRGEKGLIIGGGFV